jgi:uncharacterized SAM-binding protein YcdF (DUF218 family)
MILPRPLRTVLGAAAALALLWGAGFVWFLRIAERTAPLPPQADGIVVLTGGAGRVEAALRLLAEGRARVALVSGVGGAAAFSELARRAGVEPELSVRVTLGRAAQSTRGNAAETAAWARANALESLIVVTAFYHMPRALAELARALPGVALYPAPVAAEAPWRLLAGEYTKWLAAELGLSAWEAHSTLHLERGT